MTKDLQERLGVDAEDLLITLVNETLDDLEAAVSLINSGKTHQGLERVKAARDHYLQISWELAQ